MIRVSHGERLVELSDFAAASTGSAGAHWVNVAPPA